MNILTRLKDRFDREISHVGSLQKAFFLRQKYHALYLMASDREIFFEVTNIEYFDRFPHLPHPRQEEYWMVPEVVESFGEIDVFHASNDKSAMRILNAKARVVGKPWRLYQGKRFVGISEKGEEENGPCIRPRNN